MSDSKSGINTFTCKYGTSNNNYNNTVSDATSSTCTISNLTKNTTYYYQICASDVLNNSDCITGSRTTLEVNKPSISYTNTPTELKNHLQKT